MVPWSSLGTKPEGKILLVETMPKTNKASTPKVTIRIATILFKTATYLPVSFSNNRLKPSIKRSKIDFLRLP